MSDAKDPTTLNPRIATMRIAAPLLRLGLLGALLVGTASCAVDPYCESCEEEVDAGATEDTGPVAPDGSPDAEPVPVDFGQDLAVDDAAVSSRRSATTPTTTVTTRSTRASI